MCVCVCVCARARVCVSDMCLTESCSWVGNCNWRHAPATLSTSGSVVIWRTPLRSGTLADRAAQRAAVGQPHSAPLARRTTAPSSAVPQRGPLRNELSTTDPNLTGEAALQLVLGSQLPLNYTRCFLPAL